MMNKRLRLVHKLWITLAFSFSCCTAFAQLSGTKTIGGPANDYLTIAAAIADLNTQGVNIGAGGVRFLVAAGYTETASNLLITASGSENDSVIFEKSGTGANPVITAAAGTGTLDGIIKFKGARYIAFDGIDLVDPVSNATDTARMEWGFALLKTDTNGSRNITIRNCNITLQKTYRLSIGVYAGNHNDSSYTEILFGSRASTPNSYLHVLNNTISDVYKGVVLKGATHLGSYLDEHDSIAGNTFSSFGGGADSASAVYVYGQSAIQISYNNINGGAGTTGMLHGIIALSGGSSDITITNNTISLSGQAVTAIHNSIGGIAGRVEIAFNNISNCAGTGNFSGIYDNSSTANISIHHNTISQILLSGYAVNFAGINFQSFNSVMASSLIYRNTVADITTSSMFGDIIGIRSQAVGVVLDSNIISNLLTISGSNNNCYGVTHYANLFSDQIVCRQNVVHDVNSTYAYATGISIIGRLVEISGNHVYNLYSSNRVIGISNGNTNMGVTISRNKIHDLESFGEGSDFGDGLASAVVGIAVSLSNPVGISYNLISGLRSYNSQSGNDITAITIDGNTVMDIAYNTVYLNARVNPNSSTHGSSVLWNWRGPLSLRNNIFVNTSDARGSGKAVVLRGYEGTTYSMYQNVSNNNLLYAGAPSPQHLVYFDFVRSFQQIYQFKTWVGPTRDSLSFSEMPHFLDTVGFSPNYLRIDTLIPTQIESGGQDIGTLQGDFLNDTIRASYRYPLTAQSRNGGWAPDIGAFEGDYTPADSMVYTSSNTIQLTGDAYRNIPRQGVIGMMVVTSGVTKALKVSSFSLDLGISSNIPTLSKAKIWYTSSSDQLDTTVLFGSVDSLSGAFTINGNQLLVAPDTNYFWLTYDVSASALPGDKLDASFISFTIGGVTQVPTTPNPAGEKMIPAALAGTYKVGTVPGADYQSITAAVRDLNQKGISAPVEFLLTDADYSGETFPIVINSTVGISATDTVVIKPDTGVNVNIYTWSSAVFILNGADHITFEGSNNNSDSRNFSISNYGGAAIWGRRDEYGDSSMYNTFKHLTVESYPLGIIFCDGSQGTGSTGRGHHFNRVEGCRFIGAQTSVCFTGDFNKAKGNAIIGNEISAGGIVVNLQDSVIIAGNKVRDITNSFYGISLGIISMNNYAPSGYEVINARVYDNEVGPLTSNVSAAGIAVAYATTGTNIIYNNLVHDITGNGTGNRPTAGIFIRGGDSTATTQIYYNTVLMKGTSTRSTPSCYAIAIADNNPNIDLRNNIFYNVQTALGATSNTYAIGFGTSVFTRLRANHNLYYTSGANAKFAVTGGLGNNAIGTKYPDLAALQAATQHDTNSVSMNPAFDSLTLYEPTVLPAIRGGAPIAGFDTDMNGVMRDGFAPTIGALELIPVYDDIGVKAVFKDPAGLRVLVKNFGLNQISGFNLGYVLNNGTPVIDPYSVIIPPYDTASVYINSFVVPNGVNELKVFTSAPNTLPDTKTENDTFFQLISYPLAGVYTIGGVSPDYANFTDAAYELVQRGVSADVSFIVRSGVYNEQISITLFPNDSPAHHVTFMSEAASRDSVILQYAAVADTANYVLKLDNTSNLSFRNITFRAQGTDYASVIAMNGYCTQDTIDQCNLQSNVVNTWEYYKTLLSGYDLQGSEMVISNNHFSGGRIGMELYGMFDQTYGMLPLNGITIEKNTFTNILYYASSINRIPNARFKNNDLTFTSNNTYAGVICGFCDSLMEITGNRIFGMTAGYAIHLQGGKGTGIGGVISNNVVSMAEGTGLMMSATGGWDDGPYNIKVYHNTINVASTNGHAAFIDVDNNTWYYQIITGVDVRNNVFSNTGLGSAVRIPLINSAAPMVTTDYNYLYSGGTDLIRRAVSTNYVHDLFYPDLTEWQKVNFVEKHSTSYRPGYSLTSLVPDATDSASWSLNGRGVHIDSVYKPFLHADALGNTRPTGRADGVPDLGAYEFTPVALPPLAKQAGVIAPDSTTIFLSVFAPKDTVATIKWDVTSGMPDQLNVRQYTGESPVGRTGMPNYMYFYTHILDQGSGLYLYNANLNYKDEWLGTTPTESGNAMTVFFNGSWSTASGTVDTDRNIFSATNQTSFGHFTGTDLVNPLPVKLVSLVAKRAKEDVALSWITVSEFNSSRFEIERSADGKTFARIGSVNAQGNSTRALQYRYTDVKAPVGSIIYYRLKIVDKDGSFVYSNVVDVKQDKQLAVEEISVYPNPFSETVYIKTDIAAAGRIKVTLMDLSGRTVHTQETDVAEGVSMIELQDTDKLQSGIYFIRTEINGAVQTKKLVKQ